MRHTMIRKLELLALIATASSLIAHGGSIPTCGLEDAESITANVTGDCGTPGVITISHGDGECSIRASGDEVGFPRSGNSSNGFDRGFTLVGEGPNGERLECSGDPKPDQDGSYTVACYTRVSSQTPRKLCDAELTPVTKTCDLAKCAAIECPEGQVARSAVGTCCPMCVDPPTPVEPPIVDSPCAKVTCPASCPDGQELVWNGGECCPECAEQSPACFDQRDLFVPTQEAELEAARACAADRDCTFTQVWTRCDSGCPVAIAANAISATQQSLQAQADQACSECLHAQPSCTQAELMPGRPACVARACVGVPFP